MIPEANNVYGILTALQGMEPVLRAVEHLFAGDQAPIYRSGYNRTATLCLCSDWVEFESTPLEDGIQHLFNGAVGGSLAEVVGFARALCEALQKAGIEHRFEIYDEEQHLVQFIPA